MPRCPLPLTSVFMSFEMPFAIRSALEGRITEKMSIPALIAAAEFVSRRYRREGARDDTQGFQIRSQEEALSYAVARMPATYAAVARVLAELRRVLPGFSPQNVLDMGAGPATATLAASQVYDLSSCCLVEPNAFLRAVGQEVTTDFLPPATTTAWMAAQGDSTSWKTAIPYDLVLASYVLNEIPDAALKGYVESLWAACSGVMVIWEPGTPQGAGIIGRIRAAANTWKNTHILAPCPHAEACPLQSTDPAWCHFSVRTSRTKLHKTLKGGDAGFEDEKFSYLILSRYPAAVRPAYRLIGHPSGTKLRELQVCGPNGAETLQVSKSHPLHKRSKKLEWGDGFDV